MEEKNSAKISLSTFFLVLSIIAIVVMGIFIYKLYNDKNAEVQKSAELQTQVNSLNETVSNLQGKINNISETINSSNSNKSETKAEDVKDSNETSQNTVNNSVSETNSLANNTSSQSVSEENTNDADKIIKTASPWGFAGSQLQKIILYANGDAYRITYDSEGFDEKNIVHKDLIAKNVEDIESNEETEGFVILKGKNIKEIEDLGWTKIQK